jgi:hypothetical protein
VGVGSGVGVGVGSGVGDGVEFGSEDVVIFWFTSHKVIVIVN